MRDLGQRVGLVHELRELGRAEKLLQGRRNRLGVDQVVRHERVLLGLTETLLHRLFDPCQARAVLVLGQFAHAAHAAVAQVIDIVHLAVAVAQIHQNLDHSQDVFVAQHHRAGGFVAADLGVKLHATDAREVIGVGVVEQALEQSLHGVLGRGFAGAHHAIDGHAGSEFIHRFVDAQGLRNVRTLVQFIGIDALQVEHAGAAQLFEQGFGQLFVGLGDDLAGVAIDDVAGDHATDQEVFGHADVRGAGLLQLAGMARSDALVLGHDDLARLVGDVETGYFTAQTFGHELQLCTAVHQTEIVIDEEVRQDRFRIQANRLEQDGDRHLATAVDTEIQDILGVELEVEPRTTVGNDARREQQLARAVGLALVVLKEHAGRTVQLRDDHALRAVDDERTLVGHERYFAHVDFLLLHFLDDLRLRSRRFAVVNDQLHLGADRRGESQATGLALAYIKGGLGQVVLEKLHLDKTVVRDDRERSIEGGLQALVRTFLGSYAGLKERGVRVFLHLQQIGNLQHAVAAAETFADSLAFGIRIGHEISGQRLESWVCDD